MGCIIYNDMEKSIEIGKLFNDLVESGHPVETTDRGYELLRCNGMEIRTLGGDFAKLKCVSRHKTEKNLVEVTVSSAETGERKIVLTTDHVCMVYTPDHFFDNINAKNLHVGDVVSIYDDKSSSEVAGEITSITDLGPTEDYVYDCEVDNESHSFYGNGILVHNSQFVNLGCVTGHFIDDMGYPAKMSDWTDKQKLKYWEYVEDFVEHDLNIYVQNLVRDNCFTENSQVLRYSLEYIADTGIYESKKHYGVRKILAEGPEIVDKIKYSGIELKKGNIPPTVKEFLADIYSGVLRDEWTADDFRKYLSSAYERFVKLDVDEIAFWKGYGTEKESTGFLEMAKGTSGIAKACTFYNHILDNLKLTKYYDQILVGDKVRFMYVKPTNKYGINVIAYKPDQYPKEFRELFEIDYDTMWDKLIMGTLRKFLEATGFPKSDPRNMNMMEVDDL